MANIGTRLRGTGFKHTLPYLWPYSSIWVLVFLVSVPGTFIGFLMTDVLTEEGRAAVEAFLITRMPIVVVAVAMLAVMLTARLAGPFVALKRAFADVAAGDMRRRLAFRDGERHLRGVEDGFNAMMDSVERHVHGQDGGHAPPDDPGSP
jgi:methyl-accepting chemotaxis protein